MRGTCSIEIEGVPVLPVPLFRVMDGKDSEDYAERVEPSSQGGRKMAREAVGAAVRSGFIAGGPKPQMLP